MKRPRFCYSRVGCGGRTGGSVVAGCLKCWECVGMGVRKGCKSGAMGTVLSHRRGRGAETWVRGRGSDLGMGVGAAWPARCLQGARSARTRCVCQRGWCPLHLCHPRWRTPPPCPPESEGDCPTTGPCLCLWPGAAVLGLASSGPEDEGSPWKTGLLSPAGFRMEGKTPLGARLRLQGN